MDKTYKIEISARTIVFTVVFLLSLRFLLLMKDLIFSLLIAFIIMSAVKPVVIRLYKYKIPRAVSAATIFITFLLFIGYIIFGLLPPLVVETSQLITTLPVLINKIDPTIVKSLNLNSLSQYLPNATNELFNLIGSTFSNLVFVFTTMFFALYFVMEENLTKKLLLNFFDENTVDRISSTFDRIEKRMSSWVWGELILMLTVGAMTFIGLILIGIKYTLPLAIIAGLLEVVPNIGPVVSTIPGILIALTQSPFLILPTIIVYFVVQQLENNLIVPLIMKRTVGLHPIVTLIALIVGGKVGGILGVLLAIPTTLFIETVVMEILKNRKSTV
jgi:predicted PurR-regulated permease PerM